MTPITFLEKRVADLEAHILELEKAFERVQSVELKNQWRILTNEAAEAFMALEQAFRGRGGKKTMKRISSPTKKMKVIKED